MTAANGFSSSGFGNGPETFGTATNISLNGTGIGLAFIQQAGTTSPITRIKFRYGARTGTPPTYSWTIETVDTSGNPTGTDIGGGSPTLKTFTPPADTTWNGTTQEVTFTNSWTPTNPSDVFAIVLRYSSGTCDGSNFSSFTRTVSGYISPLLHMPLNATLAAGSWTKQNVPNCIAWGTSSAMFGRIASTGYTTVTANTAGHRSAAYMTFPAGFGTTFSVSGIAFTGKFGAAAGSVKVAIWNTSGTVMASCTLDSDLSLSPASGNRLIDVIFDSPATLNYGEKYYYGIEVVSGTVNIAGVVCDNTTDVAAYPNGANSGLATYNGSSWTETDTTFCPVDLRFSDITVPSGGGGSVLIGVIGS